MCATSPSLLRRHDDDDRYAAACVIFFKPSVWFSFCKQAFTPAASADVKAQSVVDLDSMAFDDGGHLMTNKRCDLHSKSWR